MRTLGLLGGMSWESTVPYYRILNERVRDRLGGLHSARILLYSVDFAEIEQMQHRGQWHEAGELLAAAASRLEHAGADAIVICTNTMHAVASQVEAATAVPLLHIADATAGRITAAGLARVGLLGTRFTMEQAFYRERLEAAGLEVLLPDAAARERIHAVIYDELCRGVIEAGSREYFRGAIAALVVQGAQGIILGCTEIGLLVGPDDAPVPLFDTARIHAETAADWAMEPAAA
ncbi:aspartate/glutamate racemase family protein [Agrilutibacter solisilvae]|uniref:Aspartate/glutamate racemase family protein n=1 Tax=Agrilutibacter solisilvae TaxID=2763317 RepID=A0A974Y1I8_9GAMM|nr:aspartate/glutamate racemase family protein [Lysobacter solisilvae]QSX78828.1 aspartate/glutamate racemase family protein [Lysobacter solisilvae]